MESSSRLSLVAAFDDLVRNTTVLTSGIEGEFITFARNQEECRKKWLEAEQHSKKLHDKIRKLETETNALETKLKHARSQIEHEMKKRTKAESDRDSLERQVALIRELLNDKKSSNMLNDQDREKLAFLSTCQGSHMEGSPSKRLETINESSGSVLSPSDISYDKTEEDLDISYLRSGRKFKRASAPPIEEEHRQHTKRKKSSHGGRADTSITATIRVDPRGDHATCEVTSNLPKHKTETRVLRKSFSENQLRFDEVDSDGESYYGRKPNSAENTPRTPAARGSPALRTFNSGSKPFGNRGHSFATKTFVKPETCTPCGKRIMFGKPGLKCKDCRCVCHPDCKEQMPLPCVPVGSGTPGNKTRGQGIISDFTPSEPPMIPGILIHCINEIESRGLSEVGIYRVPGSEKEVKDLKEKFLRGKGTPNLGNINDIHTVCGCVKDFLRQLKEPLLTFRLWSDFVKAAEMNDLEEQLSGTYQAISMLPQSNRDTLAFLILHLQRVSECLECKMPASNLAKVFGPTVVGYSTPEPEPMQMINETKKQAKVMEVLLQISSDYWVNFIQADDEPMCPGLLRTPQTPDPVPHSMLGPISTTPGVNESVKKKSFFTPRFGSKSKTLNKRQANFFSSPMLK
ncbi:rac GTPase-activating protein 1 [Lingula anatina]|uniref:Rac GTPase-activating protein 1 n=1 Tax=Lingula anatina TaxID=7574 RepID=A0A1S3J0I5_LINAN|nr:rac GTPase-activating protein 1 [Lingula anatina]|eukprot:XP_013403957.1 rac GTPase-activating protein 1 [Lingula anatina]